MTRAETGLDRKAALEILAENLSDSVIRKLFSDFEVDEVRRLLRGELQVVELEPATEAKPVVNTTVVGKDLRCKLFTDGASRGNPGEAGAGSVLLDDKGKELVCRSLYLGRCTNNVAEYRALILGLQSAQEIGCSRLTILLDSQLIVRQVEGRYKVKNAALKPLFKEVKMLLAGFEIWSIAHVPREENKRADEMANRGIDWKNRDSL